MNCLALCGILMLGLPAGAAEPSTIDDRIKAGVRLHDAGDYAGAMAAYRAILNDEPHHPLATYELCFSWSTTGQDLEGLVATAREALASDREQLPALHAVLGNALDGLGRLTEGEAAFRAALERKPHDPLLIFNLGVNQSLQNKHEEASTAFLEAVTQRPNYASAWLALGSNLETLNRPARSFAAYARFLTIEPESKRSATPAAKLWALLFSGVEAHASGESKNNITITVPPERAGGDQVTSEMTEGLVLGIVAANRWVEKWEGKSDAEFFVEALDSSLTIFSELGSDEPFWAAVLPFFTAARKAGHDQAMAYDLRRLLDDPESRRWIEKHAKAIARYREWAAAWTPAAKP
ncbi:MAG TPA: hypothetical protein VJS92_03155 [Candidatus Polarisedimenticolaceae bacterium]|nr:hypothetical protein [Candidatus Polarisedimenticolaceae bacterium]